MRDGVCLPCSRKKHTFAQGPLPAAEEDNTHTHTHIHAHTHTHTEGWYCKCTHLDLLLQNVDLVLLLQELLLLSGDLQGRRVCVCVCVCVCVGVQ